MPNPGGHVRSFSQWGREEQLRAFLAWLPPELHTAPGIDWSLLPSGVMGYCVRTIDGSPDAAYLAMAVASAHGSVSSNSLLQMLRHLHSFLFTMRTGCGMQHVSDLEQEALWNGFAEKTQATRTRSRQLSAYSAVTTKHFPNYLSGLNVGDYSLMSQYQFPLMPDGFLRHIGKAHAFNENSRMRQRPIREMLVPLFPLLRQLIWSRKQLAERMLQAYQQARQQAAAGAQLPLRFQYTDVLHELHQQGQTWKLRERELSLRFTLWTRRTWLREHRGRYSQRVIRDAEQSTGSYAAERDQHFLQFDGDSTNLLWFGDLIEQRLMQHLVYKKQGKQANDARVQLARSLGFSQGCATSLPGLLHDQARWFAEHLGAGEIAFEPEALYRGILYGTALATLALTNGGSLGELLQVSAERWVTTSEAKQQLLLPDRAPTQDERRLFNILPEAVQFLKEIEQEIVGTYGEVPAILPTRQITKFDRLHPERYLFQWQKHMLNKNDVQILLRFLLHGVSLSTPHGTPLRFTLDLIHAGGDGTVEERSQELLHVFGFHQGILPHLAPSSADVYCRDFFAYWQFAESREAALQPATLERWMVCLREERYDASTINRMVIEVRHIFAAASQAGHIDRNLADAFGQVGRISTELPSSSIARGNSLPSLSYARLYKKCGNPSCSKCRDGKGHGPYWYAYWREHGKRYTVYIGPEKNEHTLAVALQKIEQSRSRRGGLQE